MVGRQLVFGLAGPDLTDADVRLFRDTRAAGVILYRRNFTGPDRLRALLEGLEDALGRRLLVATDHEGGRVVMLGDGVTIFPDNLAAGAAGDAALVRRQGVIEGRELRRLGVDLSLAPVLDVLSGENSPNIGIRSYGTDPELVARLGAARIGGLQSAGISACAKHFPGSGHAPVDAHLGLPAIDSDWGDMHAVHLVPFLAAMEAGVECLMTSHPLYPNLDPAPATPATFSRLIVEHYLRGEIGYRGVIASDDLEMGAIAALCPIGDAAVRAAAAGHDLLLVCHTEAAQRAAHAALLDAYRMDELSVRSLEKSVARIDALAARRTARFADEPPGPEPDGGPLARAIATRAATVIAAPPADFRRRLAGRVLAVFPRLSELADRITVEAAMLDEARYVGEAMAAHGIASQTAIVGVEPTRSEIDDVRARAAAVDACLLFLYDAHLYASNRALLAALQRDAPALAAVLLRNPSDARLVLPNAGSVTAYGWRRCQIDAALACLLS
jgi:beta-N-acetylhexosaminidase